MTGPTKEGEMRRTAELMVQLAEEDGVYFAVALLYDSNRLDPADLKMQLGILEHTPGSRKKK